MQPSGGPVISDDQAQRCTCALQVVYILDQVRALEREMLARIAAQGLEIVPQILVVTRLIPEAQVGCSVLQGSLRHACPYWCLQQLQTCWSEQLGRQGSWFYSCLQVHEVN